MTAYGYRLHNLTAHPGRRQPDLDLADLSDGGDGRTALEVLFEQLNALKGQLVVGSPTYRTALILDADDVAHDPTKLKPYLRVTNVERTGQRIKVLIDYGRENDFERLLYEDNSADIELKGTAPVRPYVVYFLVPKVGTQAVMVSETTGRSYAGEALVHLLRVRSHDAATQFSPDGDKDEGDWIRWAAHPMFDATRFATIMQESSDHRVAVKRFHIGADGARRSEDLRLTQQIVPAGQQATLGEVLMDWWNNRTAGTRQERSAKAATTIGTLMGQESHVGGMGFNDGEISFKENGKTQTVTPNTIEQLFVYPLGETRPTPANFLKEAAKRLAVIRLDLKIELDLTLSE